MAKSADSFSLKELKKSENRSFFSKLQEKLQKTLKEEIIEIAQAKDNLRTVIQEAQEKVDKLNVLPSFKKNTTIDDYVSKISKLSEVEKLKNKKTKLKNKKGLLEKNLEVLGDRTLAMIKEEKNLLIAWAFLYEKSAAEIESIREELNDLGRYLEVFKETKEARRKQIHKAKSELKLLKGLNPIEKEKVLEYFAAKTQEKGKLKQELKNMKSFKDKTNKEIDRDMRILNRLLKSTPEQLQENLFDLMERERDNLELIVRGLKRINSLREFQEDEGSPKLKKGLSSFEIWINTQKEKSPEEEKRLSDFFAIGSELIRLKDSPSINQISASLSKTSLRGKSASEIRERFIRLGNNKETIASYLKDVNRVISALSKKTVKQLESELQTCEIELQELEGKIPASELEENKLKGKTIEELSKDVENLESLRMSFIYQNENQIKDAELLKRWDSLKDKALELIEKNISSRMSSQGLKTRSRNSIGVKGINLEPKDQVISVSSTYEGEIVLAINEQGKAKCTRIEDVKFTGRNSKGNKMYTEELFDKLLACTLINKDEDEILLLTEKGFFRRLVGEKIPDIKSGVIKLKGEKEEKEEDRLISFVKHKSLKINKEEESLEQDDYSPEEGLENEVETM